MGCSMTNTPHHIDAEICETCEGTGIALVPNEFGQVARQKCDACDGRGWTAINEDGEQP
jgi:DnaJ-class molecular chaperone